MPGRSEFVEFVVEQMAFVGGLRVRAMFGGHGIYQGDCMFALALADRLYLKADATMRAEFEAMGLDPFTYVSRGKPIAIQYFEAPPEVFEEREVMRIWVQKACDAALKARLANVPKQRRTAPL